LRETERQFLLELWRVIEEDTAQAMKEYMALPAWDRVQLAGMGMFLGDIYKAVEQSLRCILENIEGKKIPKGESWHSDLLKLSAETGLIPEKIRRTMVGMLKYRHRIHHGYGVNLNEGLVRQNTTEAIDAFTEFTEHIKTIYPGLKKK
jgi:uncharacterized protein YutE (UPF0331/DUF86 family)